jgi:hypothetical protein
MKFPQLGFTKNSNAMRLLILLITVAAFSSAVAAQKGARGLAPEAIGVDIEQCANGPLAAPINCDVATGNEGYVRGNLVASKSHYLEGQFVPIRIVATDLVVGSSYTVTIGYDYTKGGKYATDYLGDYNETESVNNNPCVGVAGCDLADLSTFAIPTDPTVTAGFDQILGTTDDITQTPGVFSCFGCTITGVSGYTLTGSTAGDSTKSITITFTADEANVVLAYGSHISTRSDWGLTNSAINISGSPYHNFILDFPGANSGNRDLQLSAEAVVFPAFIIIEKTVLNFFLQTSGGESFSFTSSQAIFPNTANFSLVDTIAEPYSIDLTQRVGGTITSAGITIFGTDNLITVTENAPPPTWSLAGITCTSVGGVNNNTINFPAQRSVTIRLEEGEFAKCSFHNTQLTPSAAPASVSGRVTDSFGNGIGGARLSVVNAQSGAVVIAMSNPFGYYSFDALETENFYVMTISHKRYTFADDTRSFTLLDNATGVDFVANPLEQLSGLR